jgi:hypothetical protein
MAGLACAARLKSAGRAVRIFEKGRGPGGRMSTRRMALPEGGEARLDHGAQFFTGRGAGFRALCESWRADGVAAPWASPVTRVGGAPDSASGEPRYAGAPGMNAVPKAMARGHDLALGARVVALGRQADGWRLDFEDGSSQGGFGAVVCATPAEQAVDLLKTAAPDMAQAAAAARTAPCWAGLFAFEAPHPPASFQFSDGGALGWLSRSRDGLGWTAHATPAWTRDHLEAEPQTVALALEAEVRRLVPDLGDLRIAQAHRWRYALVEVAAGDAFAWDAEAGIGACGDWRLGPRVELAWTSGDALAAAILAGQA